MTLLPSLSLARAWVTAAAVGLVLIFTTLATLTLQVARADAAGCTITGTSGKDKLVGTKKADVICGRGGNDLLIGRGGNDKLVGGGGNDTIDGGGGNDTLDGGGGADEMYGRRGADRLLGEGGADILRGNGGGDKLVGGSGADTLDGGGGADKMYGGGSVDTVTYAARTAGVTVALNGTAGSGAPGEGDTINADVERAVGGSGDDTLLGGSGPNRLSGGTGHDVLRGRGGADTLVGDDGPAASPRLAARTLSASLEAGETDDSLVGGDGADFLIGGSGSDTLDGNAGNDTVSYAGATGPVTADLDGLDGDGMEGEGDTIGGDVENLTGSDFDDELTGSDAANTLDGGDGADELYGEAGGDVLDAGSGTGDLTDGGAGTDLCEASDQLIEDVPNCEPHNGFGVYNRVSLDPPPAADAQPGVKNGSKVPLAASALSTGETVVLVASESGDPSITKLDEFGGIDTSFGIDGWVYGLPALLGLDRGYPTTLQILDDEIYVGFLHQDTYLAKLDSNGVLQTGFGGDGFISLRDALGGDACPVACGDYGFKVSAAGVSVGWNDFHPDDNPMWTAGTLRFSVDNGSVAQKTTFEDGLVDGGLPSDVLAVPGGASLSITRDGNIRRYLADGGRDDTFAGDGVLEPDTDLIGEGKTVPKPQLVIAEDGFARVGLAGTPKPADGTGVPKLVETDPQWAIVEQFALDGTPTTAYGDSWTSTRVPLPAESEPCDAAADSSQSFSTSAMDPVVSGSLLPIRRCSDAIWVALDPAGGGEVIRRTGPNQPRDTDSVAVPGGTLLVYASARDIVSVELVEGELVDIAVVPRKPSLTVAEGTSVSQGVRLTSQPAGTVIVNVASEDTGVATVSPATLTFSPADWSTPQDVTVTSVPDVDLIDGSTTVTLTSTTVASASFDVQVDDTDVQSIQTDAAVVNVTEGSSSFVAVTLGRKPSSNVEVTLASSDTGAATVAPETMTFTPANWNLPQSATVSGVPDVDLVDEDPSLTLSAAGVASKVVAVNVTDDDEQAILVSTASIAVPEAGSDTVGARLAFQPVGDVNVSVASEATDKATAGPATLTFTPVSWDTPQVVTVSGVDDENDFDEFLDVFLTSVGITGSSVAVQVVDDDA